MNELIPCFQDSVFDGTLTDAVIDSAELGIDSILDWEPIRSLPLVGLIVGVARTTQNVRDRNLLLQTMNIINSFNDGSISDESLRGS